MKRSPKRLFLFVFSLLFAGSILFSGCQPAEQGTLFPPTHSILPVPSTLSPTAAEIGATATAAPAAAILASTTPTVDISTPTLKAGPVGARLAFIENSHLFIRDLLVEQSIQVEGEYRQVLGWSAHQNYLLAVRKDGANMVIDTAGSILAAFDHLPQPAFWGSGAQDGPEDWLVVPRLDAALEMDSFPSRQSKILFEPGSLGADGQAFIRWGSSGEVILTPSLAQLQKQVSFANGPLAWLQQNGPDVQSILIGGSGGSASRDFHKAFFQVLDSVPGSPTPIFLGFYNKAECSSCSVNGLELTSLDSWSEKAFPLGVVLLDTPEAYAWNPAQPGLLALAEGGSRFTLENKRLALLDVPAGTPPRYLTGKDQVVFEPAWSPDGLRLAYTNLPARRKVSGSGPEMETLLGGRAIAVYKLNTNTFQIMTHPAKDEIDGWPRWSADGQMLIYARKRLADSTTQLRQQNLITGEERLIASISGAPQACHQTGCGWDQMLAYASGHLATGTEPALVQPPTPTPIIQMDTPRQGMRTYRNTGYGFSFQYPAGWELSEPANLPNYIQLTNQKVMLLIGYRRVNQQAHIQRTGVGSGDFVRTGSIQFVGKTLQRDQLIYGGKVKGVFYQSDCEFRVGNLVFTLGLDDDRISVYEDVEISADIQKEADLILESFQLNQSSR